MTIPHLIQSKITPPRPGPRVVLRPRVTRALSEALQYRLTLLQAGAGYGKSTALAALAETGLPLIWYQVTEEDGDPSIFLSHLCHATQRALPELVGLPFSILQAWDGSGGPLPGKEVIDQYLNALFNGLGRPALVVFDDIHLLSESNEIMLLLDRLIGLAPRDLHIILAARPPLGLPNLARYRSRGEVLVIDQSVMAFDPGEITQLFTDNFGYELTPDEAELLYAATEGWAITLQLIWQSLRTGAAASIEDAVSRQGATLESLFEVLADEVLAKAPEDVQDFLKITATLREMTPEACDGLRGAKDSAAILSYLHRQELFVVDLGEDRVRYHHIFHRFLLGRATVEQRQEWHRRAARHFHETNELDAAIYHFLQAGEEDRAGEVLSAYGMDLLAQGRLEALTNYLDALSPETFKRYPLLLLLLGDLARLHSRFQEAIGWYEQGEAIFRETGQLGGVARAVRGQARVYLDTVNPSKAEELLLRALRISDGMSDREAQARVCELLAENKLNAGKLQEAERLWAQAESLRREGPSDSQLAMRVLLRTGRLAEAREQLEASAEAERRQPIQTPRGHRETLLLLSIIYAFLGEAESAYRAAMEGTRRGIELDSPFVTAVGHMRQGHALMLLPGKDRFDEPTVPVPLRLYRGLKDTEGSSNRYAQARQQFEKTIELSRTLGIPRLQVEARWGLCRSYGYQGDLAKALQEAREAIDLAVQAGDEWIASICRTTMGSALVLAARYESAAEWLEGAARGFQECSDPFGLTVARLWSCLGLYWANDRQRFSYLLPETLAACAHHGYDFLFTRPTLLGPPDERVLIPLLILARDQGWELTYAERLLEALNVAHVSIHPGYQLRVRSLGVFQVWRGENPVPSKAWRREKSRQLFQLFLTFHSAPLDREQIFEHLWPDLDLDTAQRNFKVALNALYQVLEPNRMPGSESAYIFREGSVYGLRPYADVWLDTVAFEEACKRGDAHLSEEPDQAARHLEEAVELYRGEYLPGIRYEIWAATERERLSVLFLRAADALCELHYQSGRMAEVVDIAQKILEQDNCWERAYRYLMSAYDALGDHGQMARAYLRCAQVLRDELNVPGPAAETELLYEALIQKGMRNSG